MQAFKEFQDKDQTFWAFIKFISEKMGYSVRGSEIVNSYPAEKVKQVCYDSGITVTDSLAEDVALYSEMRAELLNCKVKPSLMNAVEARTEYERWKALYEKNYFRCKLPLNKQKGAMKQVAYFTAIINIIAEKTIFEETNNKDVVGFDDDPRSLSYILDEKGQIIAASSRRFDGAYPSVINPKLVWEIKEYYYATTFGSRIADAVYETQLDGHEFRDVFDRTGNKVYHVLFADAYRTWWVQGKSYLCRLVDILNSGLVDEVIIGREVVDRWPELLRSIINS